MNALEPTCLVCGKTESQVPLLKLAYQGSAYWICPQDLPILIHKPEKLAHLLPGLDNLRGVQHE